MDLGVVRRPRNVGWIRAAALLYGDWGTSKAYVVGIGFALLGYTALPHFLAVAALTAIVGVNYIWVCKYFPNGGGVYSSAQQLSQKLAVLGALMLVADYIITASLSALEGFHYFGFDSVDAKRWAILAIFLIGALNWFGPKHTGSLAVWLAIPTLFVVIILLVAGFFHLHEFRPAPVRGGFAHNWISFVGIILALSGVEAIASATGVMRLDPDSTPEKPSVHRTSRLAIIIVLIEVAVATGLLGVWALTLPAEAMEHHEGLLRFMSEYWIGSWFGWVAGIVFGLLLLSAVNTAIVGMISIIYLLAHDGELPSPFTQLNSFGVPWIPLIVATVVPVIVLDVADPNEGVLFLASLYAIGVVGAISINLLSCFLNKKLPMKMWERIFMGTTFVLLFAVWITIASTKIHATIFMAIVLAVGFGMRALTRGRWQVLPAPTVSAVFGQTDQVALRTSLPTEGGSILVAVRGITPALNFAMEEARLRKAKLFVLYIHQVAVVVDIPMRATDDPYAQSFFDEIRKTAAAENLTLRTLYSVSSSPSETILDIASTLGVDFLVLGGSNRTAIVNLIRGNVITEVARHLPPSIRLIVIG